MEIQDFIMNVCLDAVCGIEEACKQLGHEIKIDSKSIEFDLAVTSENSREIKGKAEVLSYLGIGAGFNSNNTFTHRVRFKVFVSSETNEEQNKRRAEMCKLIDEYRNSIC